MRNIKMTMLLALMLLANGGIVAAVKANNEGLVRRESAESTLATDITGDTKDAQCIAGGDMPQGWSDAIGRRRKSCNCRRRGDTAKSETFWTCSGSIMVPPEANDCDATTPPANGATGDCSGTLASDSTCQPTCHTGYTISGSSSCFEGTLTAATCQAAGLCVDDYDLRTVAVPWEDFISCAEEISGCREDNPDTVMKENLHKHCRKTCNTCGQQADTAAPCSTFMGDCPEGKVLDTSSNVYCAGKPCTEDDVGTCCKPPLSNVHRVEFQGTRGNSFGENFPNIHRPNFVFFKICEGGDCEECPSDTECGWSRSPVYNQLDTVSSGKEHVAEFWADCAQGITAFWNVQTRVIYSVDEDDRADDLEAFKNAETKVYMAEEGGDMIGEEKPVSTGLEYRNKGLEIWGEVDMEVTSGSTRLYVVIKAKDASERIKVALRVMVTDITDEVGDCMDNKMCLREIDPSGAGSALRNNNSMQLQCLQEQALNCDVALNDLLSNCNALLNVECQSWKNCLDKNQTDKDVLQALLEAALLQTSTIQLAEHKLTPDSSNSTSNSNNSEAEGTCAHPANDDPESWVCECSDRILEACADNMTDLAACIKGQMCGSDEVCCSWKAEAGCPCPSVLLAKHNAGMQADNAAMANIAHVRRQSSGIISSIEPVALEESLSGKPACAKSR